MSIETYRQTYIDNNVTGCTFAYAFAWLVVVVVVVVCIKQSLLFVTFVLSCHAFFYFFFIFFSFALLDQHIPCAYYTSFSCCHLTIQFIQICFY